MRIVAVLISLALAAAAAAPAGACVICCQPVSYFFEEPPADLDPNELVLEVRPQSAEKVPRQAPNSQQVVLDGDTYIYRFSVVRVVRGKFDGDSVLFPYASACSFYLAGPPDGAETGLLVGFVTPPSDGWRDAPHLLARSPRSPVQRQPVDPAVTAAAQKGDLAAMMKLFYAARDPAVKKLWYERATSLLRTRADAGDASAMVELGLALRGRSAFDPKVMTDNLTSYQDPTWEWVERAVALGNARAMYLMAEMYALSSDRARLVGPRVAMSEWQLKAAEAGHACAMGKMAQNYRWGWGVAIDKEKSLYWYRRAIEAGAIMQPYGYEIEGDPPPELKYKSPLECPADF